MARSSVPPSLAASMDSGSFSFTSASGTSGGLSATISTITSVNTVALDAKAPRRDVLDAINAGIKYGKDSNAMHSSTDILRPGQSIAEGLKEITDEVKEQLDEHYPPDPMFDEDWDENWSPEELHASIASSLEALTLEEKKETLEGLLSDMIKITAEEAHNEEIFMDVELEMASLTKTMKDDYDNIIDKLMAVGHTSAKRIKHIRSVGLNLFGILLKAADELARLKEFDVLETELLIDDTKRAKLEEKRDEAASLGKKLLEMRSEEEQQGMLGAEDEIPRDPKVIRDLLSEIDITEQSVNHLKKDIERLSAKILVYEATINFMDTTSPVTVSTEEVVLETLEEMKGYLLDRVMRPALREGNDGTSIEFRTKVEWTKKVAVLQEVMDHLLYRKNAAESKIASHQNGKSPGKELHERLSSICSPSLLSVIRPARMGDPDWDSAAVLHWALLDDANKSNVVCKPLFGRLATCESILMNARDSLEAMCTHRQEFVNHIKSMKESFIDDVMARKGLHEESEWISQEVGVFQAAKEEKHQNLDAAWTHEEDWFCDTDGMLVLDARRELAFKLITDTLVGFERLRQAYHTNLQLCSQQASNPPSELKAVACGVGIPDASLPQLLEDSNEVTILNAAEMQRKKQQEALGKCLDAERLRAASNTKKRRPRFQLAARFDVQDDADAANQTPVSTKSPQPNQDTFNEGDMYHESPASLPARRPSQRMSGTGKETMAKIVKVISKANDQNSENDNEESSLSPQDPAGDDHGSDSMSGSGHRTAITDLASALKVADQRRKSALAAPHRRDSVQVGDMSRSRKSVAGAETGGGDPPKLRKSTTENLDSTKGHRRSMIQGMVVDMPKSRKSVAGPEGDGDDSAKPRKSLNRRKSSSEGMSDDSPRPRKSLVVNEGSDDHQHKLRKSITEPDLASSPRKSVSESGASPKLKKSTAEGSSAATSRKSVLEASKNDTPQQRKSLAVGEVSGDSAPKSRKSLIEGDSVRTSSRKSTAEVKVSESVPVDGEQPSEILDDSGGNPLEARDRVIEDDSTTSNRKSTGDGARTNRKAIRASTLGVDSGLFKSHRKSLMDGTNDDTDAPSLAKLRQSVTDISGEVPVKARRMIRGSVVDHRASIRGSVLDGQRKSLDVSAAANLRRSLKRSQTFSARGSRSSRLLVPDNNNNLGTDEGESAPSMASQTHHGDNDNDNDSAKNVPTPDPQPIPEAHKSTHDLFKKLVKQRSMHSDSLKVEDSDSGEDSHLQDEEREDTNVNSSVLHLRKLHATNKKLQRTAENEEARVKTLTSMMGGFPLDSSHFANISGNESDKELIQQYINELVGGRFDWWNTRQTLEIHLTDNPPMPEETAFRSYYERLRLMAGKKKKKLTETTRQ